MKLHIPDAALVRNLLTGPLDRGADYLSACELVPGKCATFGDAELKSD
jgi:hypothetical protein